MAVLSGQGRPSRTGHRPQIINGMIDPKWLLDRGCLFYAPLVPPYGAGAVIWNGQLAAHRAQAPSTETVDSDGTYWRETAPSEHLIKSAVTDTLRVEGSGARVEGAATNECLGSANIVSSDANWSVVGTGTEDGTDTAPDGTSTAQIHSDTTGGGARSLRQTITVPSDTVVRTTSLYVKKASSEQTNRPLLAVFYGSATLNYGISLNTFTGETDEITSGAVTWTSPAGFGADDAGDYWRIWIASANSSHTDAVFALYPAAATEASPAVFSSSPTGTNTVWGAQFETGNFPTSYIPTTTTSVARAADVLAHSTTGNLVAGEGAFGFVATTDFDGADLTADVYAFDFSDGSDGLRGFFDQSNSGRFTVEVLSGGAPVATLVAASAPVRNTPACYIVTWKVNDFALYSDGVLDATDTSGAAPTAVGASIFTGSNRTPANQLGGTVEHQFASDYAWPAADADLYTKTVKPWGEFRRAAT